MKNLLLTFLISVFSLSISAQNNRGIYAESNWAKNWTNFRPKTTLYSEATNIISGVIDKDLVLNKENVYLLTGVVYLANNAVITIEAGTTIRGDYDTCGTLVIAKGAKIFAQGTETNPIVFTSNKAEGERKAGDWGGIIILGDAPINKLGGVSVLDFNLDPKFNVYGGQNSKSDSGVLSFVRIEYAGRKLNAKKELNGLSLAGVGNKTKIENIQISYSNDDSFECYGGDVLLNNLISYRATDDDYDFTQGVQCTINNSLAIRYPFTNDVSRSRCLEIDSYDKIENTDFTKKMTKIIALNMTLVNNEENNQGLIKEAIYIKNDSFLEFKNSVISGFNQGILLENTILENIMNLDKIKLNNILVNNCIVSVANEGGTMQEQINNWYSLEKFIIETINVKSIDLFIEYDIKKKVDFRLKNNNISKFVSK